MSPSRVLVFGGTGFFGRYLVEDLLAHTDARLTVAGRRRRSWVDSTEGVEYTPCDVHDLGVVRSLVAQHDVILHCAGPFQYLPLNPLVAAIEHRRNYIDLSEGREYYQRVQALGAEIERAGITVFSGVSIVPTMQVMLAEIARRRLDTVTSIRTFLAPGTYRTRGPAMFHTMLMGVGTQFPVLRGGREIWVRGWSEGELARFPPPIGQRRVYHVLDWADSDVLVEHFRVGTVECKAGSEFAWVNRTLALMGIVRACTGRPHWERWTVPLRAASWMLGRAGNDAGGVLLEVTGMAQECKVTHRIAVVVGEHGGRIPAVLAGMAGEDCVAGDLRRGLVPPHAWLTPARFASRLRQRGLQLLWQPHGAGGWTQDLPLE